MARDIFLIKDGPIKNFGGVVGIPGTGYFSLPETTISASISGIQERYEHDFIPGNAITRSNHFLDVKILAGNTSSESFEISKYSFGSFQVPSTFLGSTISFQTKMRDGNFATPVTSEGALSTGVATTTGAQINIPYYVMHGDIMRFVASTGQSSDCSIKVLLKG